jgi:hypothetical protein
MDRALPSQGYWQLLVWGENPKTCRWTPDLAQQTAPQLAAQVGSAPYPREVAVHLFVTLTLLWPRMDRGTWGGGAPWGQGSVHPGYKMSRLHCCGLARRGLEPQPHCGDDRFPV